MYNYITFKNEIYFYGAYSRKENDKLLLGYLHGPALLYWARRCSLLFVSICNLAFSTSLWMTGEARGKSCTMFMGRLCVHLQGSGCAGGGNAGTSGGAWASLCILMPCVCVRPSD